MTITRDVITDLLPLYLAGEASADTRALLEQYLRDNPAFAAEIREHAEKAAAALGTPPVSPPPDHEKATLERIRRFNRHRTHTLVLAIVYSVLPFTFVFGGDGIEWVMLRDSPKQAIGFGIAGIGCWIAYYILGWRLRSGAV
jgi:anti-sigma factor RsiW